MKYTQYVLDGLTCKIIDCCKTRKNNRFKNKHHKYTCSSSDGQNLH